MTTYMKKASAVADHNDRLAVLTRLTRVKGLPAQTAPLMLNSNAKYNSRQYMREMYMWHVHS